MTDDLRMNGIQYNTAVTLFFVPYTLLEVPSNIVLKMMRPSHWMAILMFSWGLVMTLMGLTSSYGGLLAGRFFLGVTEVCGQHLSLSSTSYAYTHSLDSFLQQHSCLLYGIVASNFSAAWLSST
jgi:hypothetical protein